MAEIEEDENFSKDKKKEKEKDVGLPDLAPDDVINPIEFKMFDPGNMQKTLTVPQRAVYSFQKELAGTLQKRLENIRIKLGTDNAHPIAEKREISAELVAGLQNWEEIDPVTGHLLELRANFSEQPKTSIVEISSTKSATATPSLKHTETPPNITSSVMAAMRGSLPKAKLEDKNAMPPVNRRSAATPKLFDGAVKAQEQAEFGDYYETIEKIDRKWKKSIGKRISELKPVEKTPEVAKINDGKEIGLKKRVSLAPQQQNSGGETTAVLQSTMTSLRPTAPLVVKKPQGSRRPPDVPAFLDGVIKYFMESVSPDCNLESWLAPVNIEPVFKIRNIPVDVENTIVTIARITHSKFIDDQGIAMQIRSALEQNHGYACKWHVIVGRKFGLQVNFDRGNFLFMYIGHLGYVVFRTFG